MEELKIPKANNLENNILKKSTELFLTQGYEKTTIRQIAQACGIGRGHLYYYFKKKEDILIQIYKQILNKIYNDVINNSDNKMEVFLSYALIQCVYTYTLVFNENLFRIYLEGSHVDLVRRESQNILIDLCTKKSKDSEYNIINKDIQFSVIVGYAGECELLKRYYDGIKNFDIDSIVKTIVTTRLLLLNNFQVNEVNEIVENAMHEAKKYDYKEIINKLHTFEF